MRQIGTLPGEHEAEILVDYLLTEGISAEADEDGDVWVIWVREENELDAARKMLDEFRRGPADPKYAAARRDAQQLRADVDRQRNTAARRNVDMRQRWNQPMSRRAPLVVVLIGLCIFVFLATGMGKDPRSTLRHSLMFSDTRPQALRHDIDQPYDPLRAIKHGQVWRMVTPVFLHAGILHLAFNMWWLYYLGPQVEIRLGTVRFGTLLLVLALTSNWAQYLIGRSPLFLGISGVVYGIFGYMWIKTKLDPLADYLLSDSTAFIMFFFLVLGFLGAFNSMGVNTANWSHLGGLLTGIAIAYGIAAPRHSS